VAEGAVDSLGAAALAAGNATSTSAFLQASVEHLADLTDCEQCAILLVDEELHVRETAVAGCSEAFAEALGTLHLTPGTATCGDALHTGCPAISPDVREDPRWQPFVELTDAEGIRSAWSVPLRLTDGAVIGTFATFATAVGIPTDDHVRLAEAYSSIVALGLANLSTQARLAESYESVVLALSAALDRRDEYTASHSQATAELVVHVAGRLGVAGEELRQMAQTAVLHDIGKLGIPNSILMSTETLTEEEWSVMRQHPVIGAEIVGQVPFLQDVARAVRHEHERWDGLGYPDGLAGEQIPLASRVVFACDAFHAMTSDRPYRRALTREAALGELAENAGSQFDPHVIEALFDALGERAPDVHRTPREAEEEAREKAFAEAAGALGAEDLFVFRRVSEDTFSHLGGAGRGHGWAGNVELHSHDERHFLRALESGEAHCFTLPETGRIIGPYYARSAVIVPCGEDMVVVFGSSTDALRDACSDESRRLAERLAGLVFDVSPAKRLADELEVLDAVRSITTVTSDGVEATLSAIAERAATALSCEFGAAVVADEGGATRSGWSDLGWIPAPAPETAMELRSFAHRELPVLVQDASGSCDLPPAFDADNGATSVHALPIGDLGALVVVHAEPEQRGFTLLCQRVARAVSEAAEVVVRRALAQERLAAENAALSQRVWTDALTGVASRAAWEETLMREELHRSRSGAEMAIAIVDLDGLKAINDRHGHAAGDALLRVTGEALRASIRATDLVARIGGDEFAVLLRYVGEADARAWRDRLLAYIAERDGADGSVALSLSVGVACAIEGGTLAEAQAAADRRMYDDRRARS
jgi:diguanylate cyclase (GGDEF)-like protein/putative nucleotidyltransferase with HDIG domain